MIDNRYGSFVCVCDVCGSELVPCDNFDDAVDSMKANRWTSEKIDDDFWCNYCLGCLGGINER